MKNFKKSKKINSAFLSLWSEIEFNFSEKSDVWTILEVSFIDWFENLDEENLKFLSYFLWFLLKFFQEWEKNFLDNKIFYLFIKKFFRVFKNFPEKKDVLKIFFEIKILTKLWFLGGLNKFWDTWEKIKLFWWDKNFFDKEKICFVSDKNFWNKENIQNFWSDFFWEKYVQMEDLSVKFLSFLQKNEIENILNISIKKSEFKKIFYIFDIFLLDYWMWKFLKILWKSV